MFVRAPAAAGVRDVAVRWVADGEPEWATATRLRGVPGTPGRSVGGAEGEVWWRATIRVRNPDTRYRFLLAAGPHGYRWLNGGGVVDHDPTDASDFRLVTHPPPPRWASRSTVYEIFPDRFARSGRDHPAPPWARPAAWDDPVAADAQGAMRQFYGGDLDGVAAHLDHITDLGFDAIWLTPVWPAGSTHRYDARTFATIDPALGGDAALERLARAARAAGVRLIGDLTTNHTGNHHEWFRRAITDPRSAEVGFYRFETYPETYQNWLGVDTLPKLDHRSGELRRRLWDGPGSVAARWLGDHGFDGWRIDVANMTGRLADVDVNADVARGLRATLAAVSTDALLIAEHAHDATADLAGDGWHATMNYAGFTNPLWTWLRTPDSLIDPRTGQQAHFLGRPTTIPRLPAEIAVASMRAMTAAVPWRTTLTQWNLLGSHDTARVRSVVGSAAAQRAAATMLFTYPGVPVVFAGDEWGAQGMFGEAARTPMPWTRVSAEMTAMAAHYRALADLRRKFPALAEGGLRWVACEGNTIAYVRETPAQRLLIMVRRSAATDAADAGFSVDPDLLGSRSGSPLLGDTPLPVGDRVAGAEGTGSEMWLLDP